MFKVAVGFETDVVPIVHMTHFCQLGTGGVDYKNKIKITWHFAGAAPLAVHLVCPFQF